MAKLAILVLLVAVVAIADATTTITTTVIEENPMGRPGQKMSCSEQIQGKGFTHCLNYLIEGGSSSGRGRMYLNAQPMHLEECCAQLESVDEECRCSAIQRVLDRTQDERRSYQGQDMKQMIKAAMELPRECNWEQPKQCQTRSLFI